MLQVLLKMANDPSLAEDALVDLLMDVLADETPCPLSEKESCEIVTMCHCLCGIFHNDCDTGRGPRVVCEYC